YVANPPFAVQPFQIKDVLSIQSSTDGNDRITDGSSSDIVLGGAGNDSVFPGAGNDLIFGAYGEVYTTDPKLPILPALQLPPLDPSLGGTVEFTAGVVTGDHFIAGIVPGDHTSVVAGGHVALTQSADLQGNPDDDYIDAGAGNDVVLGEQGKDTIYGRSGD